MIDTLMSSNFIYLQSKTFMLRIGSARIHGTVKLELGLAHILVVSLITKNGKWQRRKKEHPLFHEVCVRLPQITSDLTTHVHTCSISMLCSFKDWGSSDST